MQQISKRLILISAFALAFTAIVPDAIAQKAANDSARVATDPLQIKLARSKVVVEGGREVMQGAAVAKPGDILEEVATYANTSATTLKSVEATLPVPSNTELIMASIKPANAKASIDGKNFQAIPLMRKLRQANGVDVEQAVPVSEYRYLRWYPGELQPGKPMVFSARFKVANSPVAASNAGK